MFISKCSTLWEWKWREALIRFQILWWTSCLWALLPCTRHCWCPEVMRSKLPCRLWSVSLPTIMMFSEQSSKNVFLPYLPILSPLDIQQCCFAWWVLVKIIPVFCINTSSLELNTESMVCTRGNIWIQRTEFTLIPLLYIRNIFFLIGPCHSASFPFALGCFFPREFQSLTNTLFLHQKCPELSKCWGTNLWLKIETWNICKITWSIIFSNRTSKMFKLQRIEN